MAVSDNRLELQYLLLELQRDLLKLSVSDWSGRACNFPVELFDPNDRLDLCVQMAAITYLFGPKCFHKLQLEAYLWLNATRRRLERLGWLEGGIVVIDKQRSTIRLPHVDVPLYALRLPMLRPNGGSYGLKDRLDQSCFDSSWNTVRLRLMMTDHSRADALDELARTVYDPMNSCQRATEEAMEIAQRYSTQLWNGDECATFSEESVAKALISHVTALVENQYIRDLRLGGSTADANRVGKGHFPAQLEFLKFFESESGAVSLLERQTRSLFVPDGEISLLLLRYVLSSDSLIGGRKVRRGCGRTQLQVLGLNSPERIRRLGEWLGEFLGAGDFTLRQHENFAPLLSGKAWIWVQSLRNDANAMAAISKAVRAVVTTPSEESLGSLCEALKFTDPYFNHLEIEKHSPISVPIHLYLRQGESTDRALLAFPLTGWNLCQRGLFRNLVVYFVGTIQSGPRELLAEQLEFLRVFVSSAYWPTVAQMVERDDESIQKTANIFGHDLKNQLDEFRFEKTLDLLITHSRDSTLTDVPGLALKGKLQTFYAKVEMYRCLNKVASGRFPREWLDDKWKSEWPPSPFPKDLLNGVKAACEEAIRHQAKSHAEDMDTDYPVFLRRVSRSGIQCVDRLDTIDADFWKIWFEPFRGGNAPGAQAVLAGLIELARNALKVVTHAQQLPYLDFAYDVIHVDYSITTRGTCVIVELWNPKWPRIPPAQHVCRKPAVDGRQYEL